MHGQKKRRKRSLEGILVIDGASLSWQLISEPLWSSEGGYKGMCISVRADANHRELVLEYPIARDKFCGHPTLLIPQLPQRPKFSEKQLEADIRRAIASGWDPDSRGKPFVYHIPQN
jgi:hypothetical protein